VVTVMTQDAHWQAAAGGVLDVAIDNHFGSPLS
jgi:hypothetical protein